MAEPVPTTGRLRATLAVLDEMLPDIRKHAALAEHPESKASDTIRAELNGRLERAVVAAAACRAVIAVRELVNDRNKDDSDKLDRIIAIVGPPEGA